MNYSPLKILIIELWPFCPASLYYNGHTLITLAHRGKYLLGLQNANHSCQSRQVLLTSDLSVGSTETKYIKLKTKPQNNIFLFWIFHKKWYYYFGFFFETIWLKYEFFQKNQQFWFLVFKFFSISTIQWIRVLSWSKVDKNLLLRN